jgi:hypothetical protein
MVTAVRINFIRLFFFLGLNLVLLPTINAQELFGVEYESRNLYRISAVDASLTLVGSTGVTGLRHFGSLEFSPTGTLYGFTTSDFGALYKIDPGTSKATFVGNLDNEDISEGGLAFSPDGSAYGTDAGFDGLFTTIDLNTGHATAHGVGGYDINGLAWRNDGMLIGLDGAGNQLIVINPDTAAVSILAPVTAHIGAVGGMTAIGSTGYFCTTGPNAPFDYAGSNELYSFDLFTGEQTLIGKLPNNIPFGISGLAARPVPEPEAFAMALLGFLACTRYEPD